MSQSSELTAAKSAAKEANFELLLADYLEAKEVGQKIDRRQILADHPDLADELQAFFDNEDRLARAAVSLRQRRATQPSTVDPNAATAALEELKFEIPSVGGKVKYIGDYEIIAEIARGGMGVVFRARQVSLNRTVALKMILSGPLASDADSRRFAREAEAAGQLDHPNIVPVFETGVYAGQPYYSMKFIEGQSLSQWLADPGRAIAAAAAQSLDRDELRRRTEAIATLLAKTARAVHHAHQRGIIHRDLKPANVLIDAGDEPHVADFGLARLVKEDHTVTKSGAIIGTPAYMAPEQASGNRGAVSTLSDVYSLGAILYQALAGRPPFQADTLADLVVKVLADDVEPPSRRNPRIDKSLESICLKCLAKAPEKRYGSAQAFADDLEAWLHGDPIQAQSPGLAQQVWSWMRKNVRSAIWLSLIGMGCGGLGGALLTLCYGGQLFYNAGRTYAEYFPSLPSPWLAMSFQLPNFAFVLGFVLAAVLLGGMGLLAFLIARPKDRWEDLSTGLAVGVVAGVAFYVCGIGWGASLAFTVVPSLVDLATFSEATKWPPKDVKPGDPIAAHRHPTDPLVERYPDLKRVEPNKRGDGYFPKIVADQVAGSLLGIWVGMVVALATGVVGAVTQTMIAGHLSRSDKRRAECVLTYLEWAILSFVIVASSITLLGLLGRPTWEQVVLLMEQTALTLSFAVIALAGLRYRWRWDLRLTLYTMASWFGVNRLLHAMGSVEAPSLQSLNAVELVLIVCALIIVAYHVHRAGVFAGRRHSNA